MSGRARNVSFLQFFGVCPARGSPEWKKSKSKLKHRHVLFKNFHPLAYLLSTLCFGSTLL